MSYGNPPSNPRELIYQAYLTDTLSNACEQALNQLKNVSKMVDCLTDTGLLWDLKDHCFVQLEIGGTASSDLLDNPSSHQHVTNDLVDARKDCLQYAMTLFAKAFPDKSKVKEVQNYLTSKFNDNNDLISSFLSKLTLGKFLSAEEKQKKLEEKEAAARNKRIEELEDLLKNAKEPSVRNDKLNCWISECANKNLSPSGCQTRKQILPLLEAIQEGKTTAENDLEILGGNFNNFIRGVTKDDVICVLKEQVQRNKKQLILQKEVSSLEEELGRLDPSKAKKFPLPS